MDQYRSRLKLSENFERHWSIRVSGEIHMDQSLVYLFLGKFVWTNGPESSSKVSPYTGIGPWMALPKGKMRMAEVDMLGRGEVSAFFLPESRHHFPCLDVASFAELPKEPAILKTLRRARERHINFEHINSGRTKRVPTKGVSMIRAISGNFP